MRDKENEYKRRDVEPIIVLAQQTFQLKKPKTMQNWSWPDEVPPEARFDPLSTVSATYGVALQTQFRQGAWANRPAFFVIDPNGVIRYADGRPEEDIREDEILPVLDDIEEQRRLITALQVGHAALGPVGPRTADVIPALVRSLADPNAEARAGAAASLLWIASQAQATVPALTTALGDKDVRVRRLAAMALGRVGPGAKASVPALIHRLVDEDARVRTEISTALLRIGPDAIADLHQALKHEDPRLRAAVVPAILNVLPKYSPESEATVPILLEVLKDKDMGVRLAVLDALTELPVPLAALKPAIPQLTVALKERDSRLRASAARALAKTAPHTGDQIPVRELIATLKDEDSAVRLASAYALSRTGPKAKAAVPALIETLTDQVIDVRLHAVRALGSIGSGAKAAAAALSWALKDESPAVREAAAEALKRINAPPKAAS